MTSKTACKQKNKINSPIKIVFILVFLIAWLFSISLWAQEFPCFSANVLRGCVPLTIQIDTTGCNGGGNNLVYKYSQAEGFVNRTTHTYTQPGLYSITQAGTFNATGDSLRKNNYIEVLPTPLPSFSVKFCANRGVQLNINDNTYEEYIINWGDGNIQTVPRGIPTVNHSYISGGSFSLSVTGNYVPGVCGATNAQIVNTLDNLILPEIGVVATKIKNASNGSISLGFSTDANFSYEIYRNAGANPEASLSNVSGLVTQNFDNLNTETQTLCFRIRVLDGCGNFADTDDFYCNITLIALAEDSQNRLTWTAYPSSSALPAGLFRQYILYRNNQAIQSFTDINQNEFLDTDVDCKQNYCYEIVAQFSSAAINFNSSSNIACVDALSTAIPPVVAVFNSSVETFRSVSLNWQVNNDPPITQYFINRGGTLITSNSPAQNAVDADLNINQQICYEISYTNECGNTSPISAKTCPVFLTTENSAAGTVRLSWTTYINAENFYERYIVQKIDEFGRVYEEIAVPISSSTNFTDLNAKTDRQILRYRIKTIINAATNLVSYSNIVEIKQKFHIFFPNAFTPNGDGLNDTFEAKGLFINRFRMAIYSRSGEQLFSSSSITQGWDGTFKGNFAKSDVYVYVVDLEDFLGEKFSTRGTLTLIR